MLRAVDILRHLRNAAQTLDSLASVLPAATRDELAAVLDDLASRGWVKRSAAGYSSDPSTYVEIWIATPEGKCAYGAILDRYAVELMGPPTMSVSERFLIGLAEELPTQATGAREHLARLASRPDLRPQDEVAERATATELARRALRGWTVAALRSDEASRPAAEALAALPLHGIEDIEYAATRVRETYAETTPEGDLRVTAERAAAAGAALWEARPIEHIAGVSQDRDVDATVLYEVADQAAAALAALGRTGLIDPFAEAARAVGLPNA